MSSTPYFWVYEGRDGKYYWYLRSGSDKIADSGQGYSSRYAAERGAEAVKRAAPTASILHSE